MTDTTANVLIVAGHSHTAALIGVDRSAAGVRLLPVRDLDRVYGLHEPWAFGFPIRSDAYWHALAAHAPGNSIALLYTGNEHNSNFLFEQPPYFDLIPPGLEGLSIEPDADLVPVSLVRARFRALVGPPLAGLLTRLKARGPSRIVVVSPPPPPRRNLRSYKLELPAGAGARQTSPTKMLKLWHVLQTVFNETAEECDVGFIPCLAIASDADGFLKQEFSGRDITHANRAYGRLLLDHLASTLLRC